MLDAFLTELPKGTAVTRISCYDRRPIPCDDCRYCYHREGCSKRDLDDFYAALEEADLVVIATPVYHLSFPAPLKALIDRLRGIGRPGSFLANGRPSRRGKGWCCSPRLAAGSPGGRPLLEKQLAPPLTVIHAVLAERVHAVGADSPDFEPAPYLEAARLAAHRMV